MAVGWRFRWLTVAAVFGTFAATTPLAGCSDDEWVEETEQKKRKPGSSAGAGTYDQVPASALRERPWEVLSKKGETYLTNVFYAEASENEQIMPWALDGHTMISRLVYPTLGNPNLYVKADPADELVMVLRIEPDLLDHLKPSRAPEGGDSPLTRVTLTEDADNELSFLLMGRESRGATESAKPQLPRAGVYKIRPTKVLESPEPPDMPAAFKARKTLRFVFDAAAMAAVPPGLYDARFEVRKTGEIYANVFEYQYNAVRVFDAERDEYTAVNVTDTQVAVGAEYRPFTADRLDQLVDELNDETDPVVRNAAFVTFNGDLHNGGSPGTVRQRSVATTYHDEAKRIVGALKRLNLPIFLTAGNHDGIAGIGHAPQLVKDLEGDILRDIIAEQNNVALPDYSWEAYSAFLTKTIPTPGGLHRNIYTGGFERSVGDTFGASFKEVPRADRNVILYDGFYHWQKTYGPLTASWVFGKNRYVSMNSFDLRQHRRTGWGMYSVNYGGGVSREQLEWLDRELTRGKNDGQDMVVLMHHDPRGGHKGDDHGYYSPQLEFRGMGQSTVNYVLSEVLAPAICEKPEFTLTVDQRDGCLDDGLQEWMAPDPELDKEGSGFFFSGVELLKRLANSSHARTLLLGHVHFNSLEVLRSGDTLVPDRVALDPGATAKSEPRELAIVRFTSGADLSSQKYQGAKMFGYSVLHVTKQADVPRVNRLSFFINLESGFEKLEEVDIDRTKSMPARGDTNPLDKMFDW